MGKKNNDKDLISNEVTENNDASNGTNEVEETATDSVKEEKIDSKKEAKEKAKQEKLNAKKEAKAQKKAENKEKRAETFNAVKTTFNVYAFVVKIVAAVILIAFAIVILVQQNQAYFAIFIITAGVALITAIIRLISTAVKKDEKPQVKKVTLVVSLIHAIISIYLIVAAIVFKNEIDSNSSRSGFTQFNLDNYPIFLAAILYSEAVAYFMNTVLYKVESGKFMFWLHITFITLAVVILSFGNNLDAEKIVIALAVISLVCALFVGGEAIIGYFKYRNGKKAEDADKVKDTKEENKGIEAPTNRQDEPLIDPNIIDRKDNNDSAIIQ